MDTLGKGKAKEIPDPGDAGAGETGTCLRSKWAGQ